MGDYSGIEENPYRGAYNNGRLAGIREAVEWIKTYEQNIAVAYKKPDMWICISKEELQAKLKEWGIK